MRPLPKKKPPGDGVRRVVLDDASAGGLDRLERRLGREQHQRPVGVQRPALIRPIGMQIHEDR